MRVLAKARAELIEALDAEADLGSVTTGLLEKDEKLDPRFTATAAELKAKGIEDFQLHYALQTIGRISPTASRMAAQVTKPGAKPARRN